MIDFEKATCMEPECAQSFSRDEDTAESARRLANLHPLGESPGDVAISASQWRITRLWASYEGEIRAAILRASLVAIFYSIQLVHYGLLVEKTEADILFHRQITFLSAGWLFVSLAVLVALRQSFFPSYLKFATCAFDVALLTVCAGLGSGPASPLVGCYFLIVAMSSLRFSLPLVWFATGSSMAGYLLLVGERDSTWFDVEHATPVLTQVVTLCGLAATGLAIGQLVRMASGAAEQHAWRLATVLSVPASRDLHHQNGQDAITTSSEPAE